MDVLSDLVRTLRLKSDLAFAGRFPIVSGFRVSAQEDGSPFYVIQYGSCFLELDDSGEQVLLERGDCVFLPQGTAHAIRHTPASPVMPLNDLVLRLGSDDLTTKAYVTDDDEAIFILGGVFRFDGQAARPLLAGMGRLLHIRAKDAPQDSSITMLMGLLCGEARHGQQGTQVVRTHLLDVLFVQLMRASMAQHAQHADDCRGSFLRALFDVHVGKAIEFIHLHPERKWTVGDLAAAVHMSRTAFAMRFSRLTGVAPLTYVRQWRLLRAADMLKYDDTSLEHIARCTGYDSVAAFSNTFKREFGTAPGTYRKQGRFGVVDTLATSNTLVGSM